MVLNYKFKSDHILGFMKEEIEEGLSHANYKKSDLFYYCLEMIFFNRKIQIDQKKYAPFFNFLKTLSLYQLNEYKGKFGVNKFLNDSIKTTKKNKDVLESLKDCSEIEIRPLIQNIHFLNRKDYNSRLPERFYDFLDSFDLADYYIIMLLYNVFHFEDTCSVPKEYDNWSPTKINNFFQDEFNSRIDLRIFGINCKCCKTHLSKEKFTSKYGPILYEVCNNPLFIIRTVDDIMTRANQTLFRQNIHYPNEPIDNDRLELYYLDN